MDSQEKEISAPGSIEGKRVTFTGQDAKLSERVAYMAGQNEVLERTLSLLISAEGRR